MFLLQHGIKKSGCHETFRISLSPCSVVFLSRIIYSSWIQTYPLSVLISYPVMPDVYSLVLFISIYGILQAHLSRDRVPLLWRYCFMVALVLLGKEEERRWCSGKYLSHPGCWPARSLRVLFCLLRSLISTRNRCAHSWRGLIWPG